MMYSETTVIPDEDEMRALGETFGRSCHAPMCVFLRGPLGAGKTTFCRGILKGRGYSGVVPSPSYQLVQTYDLPSGMIYHVDLYRLGGPADFESLGLNEGIDEAILLIEWPEHGAESWFTPDIECVFSIVGSQREVIITGMTEKGKKGLHEKRHSD